ncbi:hypothetical protein [Metamycoplasma hominis]|uniref:hypothetical protein n=1 Tax=Metamycoplasma hominis TaxID=2098 RepID=UPI003CEC3687
MKKANKILLSTFATTILALPFATISCKVDQIKEKEKLINNSSQLNKENKKILLNELNILKTRLVNSKLNEKQKNEFIEIQLFLKLITFKELKISNELLKYYKLMALVQDKSEVNKYADLIKKYSKKFSDVLKDDSSILNDIYNQVANLIPRINLLKNSYIFSLNINNKKFTFLSNNGILFNLDFILNNIENKENKYSIYYNTKKYELNLEIKNIEFNSNIKTALDFKNQDFLTTNFLDYDKDLVCNEMLKNAMVYKNYELVEDFNENDKNIKFSKMFTSQDFVNNYLVNWLTNEPNICQIGEDKFLIYYHLPFSIENKKIVQKPSLYISNVVADSTIIKAIASRNVYLLKNLFLLLPKENYNENLKVLNNLMK